MKKIIYFLTALVFFTCYKKNNTITYNEKEKKPIEESNFNNDSLVKKISFGNLELTKYKFPKKIWINDLNDKFLQNATKPLYKDDYENFKNIKIEKLNILPIKSKYILLNSDEINTKEEYNSENILYLLTKSHNYNLYYLEVEITDIENNLFENQKGGFLVTIDDNNNKIIDKVKFNHNLYYTKESTDRWNFLNLKLSYIDKAEKITSHSFLCKEWDLSFEFKLIETNSYQIDKKGKIIKL